MSRKRQGRLEKPSRIRDRIFTQRLDHFAPTLSVQWRKMSLSSAGTRWGSASANGSY